MNRSSHRIVRLVLAITLLLATGLTVEAQQYVFISDDGYFLNSSAEASQTFTESTCVWTCINNNDNTENTLGGTSRRLHIGDIYLRGRNSNDASTARTGGASDNYVGQWRSVDNYLVHYSSKTRYVYNNSGTPSWNNNNTRPSGAFGVYTYTKTSEEDFTVAAITGVNDVLTTTGNYNLSSAASYTPESYKYTGPDTKYYAPGITTGAETSNSGLGTKTSGFTSNTWSITPSVSGVSINNSGVLSYTSQVTNDVQITIKHTVTENGKTQSAEKTITLQGTGTPAPTISNVEGTNNYTISVPVGSTVKYTIDGNDINATASNGNTYSAPIPITTPNTIIKARAIRNGIVSEQATYIVSVVYLSQPTINITTAGVVTITNLNTFATDSKIYYTTNGQEPTSSSTLYDGSFTVDNMQTIKAVIIAGTGYQPSCIVSNQYRIESGVSGGVVTLNDYEDHNWSYYSDSESPIKSLYPRNVKITYYGYGTNTMTTDNNNPGTSNMTDVASTAVAVSMYEPENTFVYYKTLERYVPITNLVEGTPQNIYPYDLIPNPFSKRPTYGTDGNKWRGFYGWRIKSIIGGAIYSAPTGGTMYSVGDILTTEYQKLYFQPTDNTATNANNVTSMTIEFEAVWARAYRVETSVADVDTKLANNSFSTDVSYERNFLVVNSGTTSTDNLTTNRPVTVMMMEPDGSADYRVTTRYINPAYVIPTNNIKFEWMNMRVSNTLSANAKNLVVGRGVKAASAANNDDLGNMSATGTNPNPTVTANRVHGLGSTTSNTNSDYSTSINYYLRLESGVYENVYYVSSSEGSRGRTSNSATLHVTGFFGNDYDRANNNNDRMVAKEAVLEGTSNGFNNTSSRYLETMHLTMKSGIIGTNYNKEIAGSTYKPGPTNACYIAVGSTATACGMRRFIVEGGSISCITGGMETWETSYDESIKNKLVTDIRVKYNSIVRSAAFGGPANAEHFGLRRMVLTGGHVYGWVAGACNGDRKVENGQLRGSTQVYVGGNTIIGDKSKTANNQIEVNGSKGGNVFGAGRGRSDSEVLGEVTYGTNVVIADDAYVVNNVYGGGDLGYALTTANVHILGGEVKGSVFGGANQKKGVNVNIVMRGGLVRGGVYGGCNTTGTVSGNATIQINGGQVGVSGTPANVHGGGYGSSTIVSGSVNLTVGANGATEGATIYGDVYGGSAEGKTNGSTSRTSGAVTNVTLNAGIINGSLYGGGLGTSSNAADVYGPVQVTVNGGEAKNVFGCNNINGRPRSTVNVLMTGGEVHECVYGGGNAAAYTGTPQVKITGGTVDESVFGGGLGSSATITGDTRVIITGTSHVKQNVYGGGNGGSVSGQTHVDIGGE